MPRRKHERQETQATKIALSLRAGWPLEKESKKPAMLEGKAASVRTAMSSWSKTLQERP